jgi:hypothetical protein
VNNALEGVETMFFHIIVGTPENPDLALLMSDHLLMTRDGGAVWKLVDISCFDQGAPPLSQPMVNWL